METARRTVTPSNPMMQPIVLHGRAAVVGDTVYRQVVQPMECSAGVARWLDFRFTRERTARAFAAAVGTPAVAHLHGWWTVSVPVTDGPAPERVSGLHGAPAGW